MPSFSTIFYASIGFLAFASAAEIHSETKPISEVKTFDPAVGREPGRKTSRGVSKNIVKDLHKRDFVDCLFPGGAGAADYEDCSAICSHFEGQGGLTLQPFNTQEWSTGTCGMGIVNLNPCEAVTFSNEMLRSHCAEMLAQCVINGYDGYAETDSPRAAWALYGLEAPPAYPSPPAC